MLPTPLVRPLSALRRWLRFSWLGRLPFPRTTRHTAPPRKPAAHQPQVEGYEDRSSFSDPSVLGAAMPLAGVGLLAAPLLTPSAILRDGGSPVAQDPLTSTLGASPAPPAVQDLVFASWSSRGDSLDLAIEAATGRQPAGEPEFVLPPGATELVLADKGPDDTSWLDDLDGVLGDRGGKAGGTGFAGLPGLPDSGWNAGGLSDGYERGGRGPLWDSSARGLEQTGNGNDNPYSYPGLFDSFGTTSRSSAGGLTTPSVAETWGESGQAAVAVAPPPPTLRPDFGALPLAFEPNRGQVGGATDVGFLARPQGMLVQLRPAEAVLVLNTPRTPNYAPETPPADTVRDALRIQFVGANDSATLSAHDELRSRSNYFRGGEQPLILSDLPNYGAVVAEGVYDGIDVVYQGEGSLLRFDLHVRPGGDVADVALGYQGVQSLALDESGRLLLDTPSGQVVQDAPVVYQVDTAGRRQAVAGRYVLREGGAVAFDVGDYDRSRELVLDPTVSYAGYLGGTGADSAAGITVDAAGSVYVTGAAGGTDFPGPTNTLGTDTEIFVTKFTPAGELIYTSFIGSDNGTAFANALAVDAAGNAYVAGSATTDFYTTAGAYQTTVAGGQDAFAFKLSASGGAVIWSTLLGGDEVGGDWANGLALDSQNNLYVVGATSTSDFPTTGGAYQEDFGGGSKDAFLTRIRADGAALLASTLLGGGWDDEATAVAVDGLGYVYVAGWGGDPVSGDPFPTTAGAYQEDAADTDEDEAFVAKLDAGLSAAVWSTLLGGDGSDSARELAVDASGVVTVAGHTESADFPTTGGAFDTSLSGSGQDLFVTRLGSTGASLVWSSLLGGDDTAETVGGLAVDDQGRVWVVGMTVSTDFPEVNELQDGLASASQDAFLTRFAANGASIDLSSYLGGEDLDGAAGVALDADGNAFLVGTTFSDDFPGANNSYSGNGDVFLVRLDRIPAPVFTGISTDSGTSGDETTTDTTLTLSGTSLASATVTVYRAGLGLLGTATADGSGNWIYDYTATTLAEGSYAFTATQTSGGLTSRPSDPFAVVVDVTAPEVTLVADGTTSDPTPTVLVLASDLFGLADGTTVTLDVDLNNDNDFTDTSETGYTSGTLSGGAALLAIPALGVGTVRVQARVSDRAGNEGTSAAATLVISSSGSAWTITDTTVTLDALAGDSLLQSGNLNVGHALDLDLSPGTWVAGSPYLSFNSERVDVRPVIAAQVQSDNGAALPATITAQLTWNGGSPQTPQVFSTSGLSAGDLITVAQRVDTAVTTTGRYTYQLDVTMDYGSPITRSITGSVFVVAEDTSALGAGWTLGGVDRLVDISASGALPAGKLRVYGGKHASFYEGTGTFTSPTGDNGTLTTITGGFRYESPDGWRREFDSSGYQTSLASPDGTWRTTYTWGSGRLTGIEASDGSRTTLTYDGSNKISTIQTGPRTVTATVDGSGDLTNLTNPDGGLRTLTYDGDHRLTQDDFGVLSTTYAYSDGALSSFRQLDGTANTLVPAGAAGLNALAAGTVRASFTDGVSRTQRYRLDSAGRPVEHLGADGGLTKWTRDGNGWVTGITDALGRVTTLTLDSKGYVTNEALPDGNSRAYQYDPTYHGVTKVTDERGKVTTVTYSGSLPSTTINAENKTTTQVWSGGLLQTVTDALGRVTTHLYDAARRLQATIDAAGGRVTLTYDNNGNVETRKDQLGRVVTYTNDALGRVLRVDDSVGMRGSYAYDGTGLVLSSTDAAGVRALREYDRRGLQTRAVEAVGAPTQRSYLSSYDGAGQNTQSRNAGGFWEQTQFDGAGRPQVRTDESGFVSRSAYDRAGQAVRSQDELSQAGSLTFNLRGWLTRQVDAQGGVYTQVFDQAGNLTGSIDPRGQRTSHVYDDVGRLVSTTEGVGTAAERTTTHVYDAVGNLVRLIDPSGQVTSYLYDALNRVTLTKYAAGTADELRVSQVWNADSTLAEVTGPGGLTTQFTRDARGRVTKTVEAYGTADARTTTSVYDLRDQLTAVIDALGRTVSYVYDALGQRTQVVEAVGTGVAKSTELRYDADGRQVGVVEPLGSATQNAYDPRGLPIVQADALGNKGRTFHDAAGNVTAYEDALGNRTEAGYDGLGRQVTSRDALGFVTTSVYDSASNLIAQVNARGYRTTYSYDDLGRVFQVEDALNGLATTLYDSAGNVQAQVDQLGRRTTFVYDGLQRHVATIDPADNRTTSVYDAAGNVEATIDALGRRTTFVYDSLRRLVATEDALGNRATNVYDALGNLTARVDALGNRTTTVFDARNRAEATIDALGNRTTSVFDALDRVEAVVDALGRRTTFVYDLAGRMTAQVDALGRRVTSTFDQAGNLLTRTDAAGSVTSYGYDALNRVQSVTDALGFVTTSVFDEVGNLAATVNARGYRTTTVYDALDRAEAMIDALGNRTTAVFDAVGNQTVLVNARNHRTTYVYDVLNRLEATVDALGNRSTNVYDAVNLLAQVDALNQRTTFGYDALNRQITTRDALNQVATTAYDAVGNVKAVTNARGYTTSYGYDNAYRLTQVEDALNNLSTVVYDAVGNATAQVDARGNRTTSVYDALNRVIERKDALNHTWTTAYDQVGRVEAVVDALGERTTFAYDAVGRRTRVTDAGGGVVTTVFDAVGNAINTTDAAGNLSTVVYDALNRSSEQIDARGAVVTLLYDSVGNNTAVVDPVGNRTTFVYDALDRVTDETDPLNKTATTAYDALGRVSSTTDRLGQRRDYSYDAAGRQTGEVWKSSGGATVNTATFAYDANHNRTVAQDAAGTYTMGYDALDRLTSEQGLHGLVLTHVYDAVGNRTRTEDSKGGVTTSVYNAVNLLTRRDFGGPGQTPLRFDQTYTDRNELSGVTRYSDLAGSTMVGTTSLTYDDVGRTLTIHHRDGTVASLVRATYVYDVAGRLTHEDVDGAGRTFTYDAANQLTAAGAESYSFDDNGNRTMSGYSTGTGNRMTNDGTWTYTYDDAGQRSKKSKGALLETWTHGYNHRGQMAWAEQRATDGGTLQLRLDYVYDVFGNRVAEDRWTSATGTVTTRFGYDGTDVWADLDGSNALQNRYVRPDGIDALAARVSGAGTAGWYLVDRQGTVLANASAAGAVTNRNTFNGFGGVTSQTNATAAGRYLYTGKEYQADLCLQHNDARYYDPFTGRWTSIDPIGFQAGDRNLYRYVGNNPSQGTDPTGQYVVTDSKNAANKVGEMLRQQEWGLRTEVIPLSSGRYYVHVLDSSLSRLFTLAEKYGPEENDLENDKERWLRGLRRSTLHFVADDRQRLAPTRITNKEELEIRRAMLRDSTVVRWNEDRNSADSSFLERRDDKPLTSFAGLGLEMWAPRILGPAISMKNGSLLAQATLKGKKGNLVRLQAWGGVTRTVKSGPYFDEKEGGVTFEAASTGNVYMVQFVHAVLAVEKMSGPPEIIVWEFPVIGYDVPMRTTKDPENPEWRADVSFRRGIHADYVIAGGSGEHRLYHSYMFDRPFAAGENTIEKMKAEWNKRVKLKGLELDLAFAKEEVDIKQIRMTKYFETYFSVDREVVAVARWREEFTYQGERTSLRKREEIEEAIRLKKTVPTKDAFRRELLPPAKFERVSGYTETQNKLLADNYVRSYWYGVPEQYFDLDK